MTATATQTKTITTQTATVPTLSAPITAGVIEEVFTTLMAAAKERGAETDAAFASAKQQTIDGLKAVGYQHVTRIGPIVETHHKKLQASGLPLIAPATPSTVTRELVAFIDPQASFPEPIRVGMGAGATTARSEEVAAAIAEASNQNAPAWLQMSFDPDETASVDFLIDGATQKAVPTLAAMMDLARTAFEAVEERKFIKGRLTEQKALLEAGSVDEALAISVDMAKSFPTAPFSAGQIAGPIKRPISVELSRLTNGALDDFDVLVEMVVGAEPAIKALDGEIVEMRREIRKLMPKNALSQDAVDGIACEMVMRRASDLFENAYNGTDTMLDFDVQTAIWAEPHPDVPAIDPTFHFYAPHLADVLHSITRNKVPSLVGESGCGKSEFVMQVGAYLGLPVYRLNMDSHQTRADLIGQHKIVQSENGTPQTVFVEGMLPRAISQPSILLIDEWDAADPEIMPILQPILEGRGVMILEDGARYVKPHPFSRIVLTGNTNGRGSANAAYNNIHEQSAATIDRIEKFLRMPYLPADLEKKVVEARVPGVDQTFVAKLIQLATKIREAYDSGDTQQLCSTRTVMACAERHRDFAPMYSDEVELIQSTLEVCLLSFCAESDRTTVKGLIDGIFS